MISAVEVSVRFVEMFFFLPILPQRQGHKLFDSKQSRRERERERENKKEKQSERRSWLWDAKVWLLDYFVIQDINLSPCVMERAPGYRTLLLRVKPVEWTIEIYSSEWQLSAITMLLLWSMKSTVVSWQIFGSSRDCFIEECCVITGGLSARLSLLTGPFMHNCWLIQSYFPQAKEKKSPNQFVGRISCWKRRDLL